MFIWGTMNQDFNQLTSGVLVCHAAVTIMKKHVLLTVALSALLVLAGGCQTEEQEIDFGQKALIDQVQDLHTSLDTEQVPVATGESTGQPATSSSEELVVQVEDKTVETNVNFDFYKKTCEQAKGMLITINAWKGKWEACYFDDGSLCEMGALTRDECRRGGCHEVCDKQNTELEGWYDNCSGNLIRWANCADKK